MFIGFNGDVVQLYPNIAENVYGYIVTLTDDLGNPIINTEVHCKTNEADYITDDHGTITEVVYSTNTSAIVEFELTNQPWADGTYHLDWVVSGKTPGVIQSVSSTAIRTYDGCAYTITFKNYDGNLWVNNDVYCTTLSKTYQTNETGTINCIAQETSLEFRLTTTQDTSVSGDFQMLNTYNVNCTTADGELGSLVIINLTGAKSLTSSTPNKINQNVPTPGASIDIGTREYLVVHDDNSNIYVMLRYWEEDVAFSDDRSMTYPGSVLASECTSWYNSNVSSQWKNADVFNSLTVAGVYAKCFVPTYNQVRYDWPYLEGAGNQSTRYFYDTDGERHNWWLSEYYTDKYLGVVHDGGYAGGFDYDSFRVSGFRPALAIKRSKFLNG